jgi:hypothetical protein
MITVEQFVERLCRLGGGRDSRPLPRKRLDRQILMKSMLMDMASDRTYSEPEINELLEAWNRNVAPAIQTDPVTLRRLLVDHGHLERTANGGSYRVGLPARPVVFDLEVDDIDLRATIAAYRQHLRTRPRPPGADRRGMTEE